MRLHLAGDKSTTDCAWDRTCASLSYQRRSRPGRLVCPSIHSPWSGLHRSHHVLCSSCTCCDVLALMLLLLFWCARIRTCALLVAHPWFAWPMLFTCTNGMLVAVLVRGGEGHLNTTEHVLTAAVADQHGLAATGPWCMLIAW